MRTRNVVTAVILGLGLLILPGAPALATSHLQPVQPLLKVPKKAQPVPPRPGVMPYVCTSESKPPACFCSGVQNCLDLKDSLQCKGKILASNGKGSCDWKL